MVKSRYPRQASEEDICPPKIQLPNIYSWCGDLKINIFHRCNRLRETCLSLGRPTSAGVGYRKTWYSLSIREILINPVYFIISFNFVGTVAGWGFDENGKVTEELTKAHMPVVSQETCIYSFPDFYSRFTSEFTFCAGFKNGRCKKRAAMN